jgi:hypothetical protein
MFQVCVDSALDVLGAVVEMNEDSVDDVVES